MKKLIGIAKECVLGLQMEVKRKLRIILSNSKSLQPIYSLQPSKSPFEVGFSECHRCLLGNFSTAADLA